MNDFNVHIYCNGFALSILPEVARQYNLMDGAKVSEELRDEILGDNVIAMDSKWVDIANGINGYIQGLSPKMKQAFFDYINK